MESQITDIMEPFGIVGPCWKDEDWVYITLGTATLAFDNELVPDIIQGLELLIPALKQHYKE